MARLWLRILLAGGTVTLLPALAIAEDAPAAGGDNSNLLNLSLQQLSDIEVTSVSKRAEKASQAAAAIYVITQEDIRRSGLQNVPELLRMVPGLDVAQSGSQNWAISSRGFNGEFANKLLVLIDGRTVYTPVFSGVYWDVQNLMVEDIERIEVIRGPGATLWGANAVNGVINIITKSAKDTQGTLITAAAGNQERASVAGRYGGTSGDLAYRTYAQYFNNNEQHTVSNPVSGVQTGMDANDKWQNGQGGFRMDWGHSDKEMATLQGDAYQGQEDSLRFFPTTNAPFLAAVNGVDDVSGMNILGRVTHEVNANSNVTLQAYYDDAVREAFDPGPSLGGGASFHTQTFDVDFQNNITLGSRSDVTWGLGYRRIASGFGDNFYVGFTPENYDENLYSGFLQDKITLLPEKVFLTLGTKLEHNDFSGFEWEPSARIAWTPTQNQTIWASVSRAVRALTQGDQNVNLIQGAVPNPAAPPNAVLLAELGSTATSSEDLTAYELGYRIQPKENISIDLTGFVNEYSHLSSSTQGSLSLGTDPVQGAYVYDPEVNSSNNSGESHGVELSASWQAASWIKFSGGYSIYYETIHIVGPDIGLPEGHSPKQQFNARAYVDLPSNLQWDTMVYYMDTLPGVSDGFGDNIKIPAYTRLDMRLGWTPMKGLDVSLIGQNLLQSEHQEYSPFLYQTPEEIGRSVLAKATVRF